MRNFDGFTTAIIDDDAIDTEIICSLLDKIGFHQYCVIDWRNIGASIEQLALVNIIFLDLEMPGQNGYDVLGLLQQLNISERVPIVAYSAHIYEMVSARQAGFHSFLGKPLDSGHFAERVMMILNGQPVWELR